MLTEVPPGGGGGGGNSKQKSTGMYAYAGREGSEPFQ